MTATQFKAARAFMNVNNTQLGNLLEVKHSRTIRRWASGESSIPGPVSVLMEWLAYDKRPKQIA